MQIKKSSKEYDVIIVGSGAWFLALHSLCSFFQANILEPLIGLYTLSPSIANRIPIIQNLTTILLSCKPDF